MKPFLVGFILILFSLEAWAQDYGGLGSSEPSPRGHISIAGGYRLRTVRYSADNSENKTASGSGFHGGFEFNSTSSWPKGLWTLGLYYFSYQLELEPNSIPETLSLHGVELPLMWGFYLNRRFLFSLGFTTVYEFDQIERTSEGKTTHPSHKAYGINAVQVEGLASLRYFQFVRRKPRIFLDIRYGMGLFDRAVGEKDQWRDQTTSGSLGLYF